MKIEGILVYKGVVCKGTLYELDGKYWRLDQYWLNSEEDFAKVSSVDFPITLFYGRLSIYEIRDAAKIAALFNLPFLGEARKVKLVETKTTKPFDLGKVTIYCYFSNRHRKLLKELTFVE